MLDAARHVNNNALAQLDLAAIKLHPALPADDIVNLVGALVVMQFGVGDFEVVHLSRRAVLFFDQRTDLPARFGPRDHISLVSPDVGECLVHTLTVWYD